MYVHICVHLFHYSHFEGNPNHTTNVMFCLYTQKIHIGNMCKCYHTKAGRDVDKEYTMTYSRLTRKL